MEETHPFKFITTKPKIRLPLQYLLLELILAVQIYFLPCFQPKLMNLLNLPRKSAFFCLQMDTYTMLTKLFNRQAFITTPVECLRSAWAQAVIKNQLLIQQKQVGELIQTLRMVEKISMARLFELSAMPWSQVLRASTTGGMMRTQSPTKKYSAILLSTLQSFQQQRPNLMRLFSNSRLQRIKRRTKRFNLVLRRLISKNQMALPLKLFSKWQLSTDCKKMEFLMRTR